MSAPCTDPAGHYWQLLDRKTTGNNDAEILRFYCTHCQTIDPKTIGGFKDKLRAIEDGQLLDQALLAAQQISTTYSIPLAKAKLVVRDVLGYFGHAPAIPDPPPGP